MSKLLYYLVLLPISKLPISVLHTISTGLYFVLYKVLGYRKKVVFGNLERSFSEKTSQEIEAIGSDFYRHFCDLIFESIRLFSMSLEEWRKYIDVTNPEVLDAYYDLGKPILIFQGHYGNWEWIGTGFALFTQMDTMALYSPLKDKFFNGILNASRGKGGMAFVPKKEAKSYMKENKNHPVAILFGGDQSPTSSHNSFWMDFLNQDTSIAFGTEKFAIEYDCPVLFADVKKIGRGQYTTTLKLVTNTPREEEHGFITKTNMRLLEQTIKEEPRYWLWTHRRWKRKREENQ